MTKNRVMKLNSYIGKNAMHITILTILLGLFQLTTAAAPSEPVQATLESLMQLTAITARAPFEVSSKSMQVTVTGYSSTYDQTDDTPWITAANTPVRDGIVAANFLPFGTKVKIPELFGEKVFVVEDRMHSRFSDRIDVWFPDRALAQKFGKREVTVVIFEA